MPFAHDSSEKIFFPCGTTYVPLLLLLLAPLQEFVQAEVDREEAAIARDRERARKEESRSTEMEDQVRNLRDQLVTLQEGIGQVCTTVPPKEERPLVLDIHLLLFSRNIGICAV